MTLRLFLIVTAMMFVAPMYSQSISPMITEYRVKPGQAAKGSFVLTDNLLTPMVSTFEGDSFSVIDGKAIYRPLDSDIHLELSSTSAKVGISQTEQIDYKITCDQLPCYLSIRASTITGKTKDGILIKITLPTVLYLCDKSDKKQKDCREYVRSEIFHMN
jgi:hypothetical protein